MIRVTDDDLVLGDDYAFYYEGAPFTGVCYENRPDGTLWSEITYERGLKHGPSRTLYPDGSVQSQTLYKLAYADGWKEEWRPNGRLRRRTLYELAVPVQVQEFDWDGKLVLESRIDPASDDHRRLEAARRNEPARLERIRARFGHVNEVER